MEVAVATHKRFREFMNNSCMTKSLAGLVTVSGGAMVLSSPVLVFSF